MKRIVFTLILVVILVGIGVVFYVFYKPHRTAESEKASVTIKSSKLFVDYSADQKKGDNMYLNKMIEVEGRVSEISKDNTGARTLVLKEEGDVGAVVCSVDEELMKDVKLAPVNVGDVVVMKGICSGFDDLLGEVRLTKCIIQTFAKDKAAAIQ